METINYHTKQAGRPKGITGSVEKRQVLQSTIRNMSTAKLTERINRYTGLINAERDTIYGLSDKIEELDTLMKEGKKLNSRGIPYNETTRYKQHVANRKMHRERMTFLVNERHRFKEELDNRVCRRTLDEISETRGMSIDGYDARIIASWPVHRDTLTGIMLRALPDDVQELPTRDVTHNQVLFALSPFFATKVIHDYLIEEKEILHAIDEMQKQLKKRLPNDVKLQIGSDIKLMQNELTQKRRKCYDETHNHKLSTLSDPKHQSEGDDKDRKSVINFCDDRVMIEQLFRMQRHMAFMHDRTAYPMVEEVRYADGIIYILAKRVETHDDTFLDRQIASTCMSLYLCADFAVALPNCPMPRGYSLYDATQDALPRYSMKDLDLLSSRTFHCIVRRCRNELPTLLKQDRNGLHKWWLPCDIHHMERYESIKDEIEPCEDY